MTRLQELRHTVEVEDGMVCGDCGHALDPETEEPVTLYECGECSTIFTRDASADGDSNRCPECNRFAAKLTEAGCPECEESEMEPVDVTACPVCNELVAVELIMQHLWNDECDG